MIIGRRLAVALIVAALSGADGALAASTLIGDWESGTREGWIDWDTGAPTATVGAPRFQFNSVGASHGTGAIQYNLPGGYAQWLAIKLQLDPGDPLSNGLADYRQSFLENAKLAFDVTLVASEQAPGNDYTLLGVFVLSNTWGFNRIGDPNNDYSPESVSNFIGFGGGKSWNPSTLVGTQTSTWTYDIGFLHDGNAQNGEIVPGNYIEIIFEEYSNASSVIHLDNVRLLPAVPEPLSGAMALLVAAAAASHLRRRR